MTSLKLFLLAFLILAAGFLATYSTTSITGYTHYTPYTPQLPPSQGVLQRITQAPPSQQPYIPLQRTYRKGDVNGDNLVDSRDLTLLRNHLQGKQTLSREAQERADVNHDRLVNGSDYLILARYVIPKTTIR